MKPAPLSPAQRELLSLLRTRGGESLSRDAILDATGWKRASFDSYFSKGRLSGLLQQEKPGQYLITAPRSIDEWSLYRQMSQHASANEAGASLSHALARALIKKTRDNMTLALELYNRPSLENRLDGFCMLFCTAWEQLLKAELIERDGEPSIYRPKRPGKRLESISLSEALERTMDQQDHVRQNVELVAELRHGATHLLMPETQAVLSGVFQAGVLNFARHYINLVGSGFLPSSSSGLLSLVADARDPNVLSLEKMYGSTTATEIGKFISELRSSIQQTNSKEYAIDVTYQLVLTSKATKADIKLTAGSDATNNALILIKPSSIERTHPFMLVDLLTELNKELDTPINSYDLLAIIMKEKWEKSNNEFRHELKRPPTKLYSQKALEFIKSKVRKSSTYISEARSSYSTGRRARK